MTLKKMTAIASMLLVFVSTQAIAAGLIAQARTALVIGNAAYQKVDPLKNSVNDAQDMRDTLKSLGFTVIYLEDAATQADMRKALDAFYEILNSQKGEGLFFYAGHGIQVKGENYLIPTQAKIDSESDVLYELLSVKQVFDKMQDARNPLNVIILDACRNNPFKGRGIFRDLDRDTESSRGLAPVQAPTGSMVIFSTAANEKASDGSGRNGTYTKHFKEWIKKPNLKVEDVLKGVRNAVMLETGHKQVPYEYGGLLGDFCFVSCPTTNHDELIRANEDKDKKIDELLKQLAALQVSGDIKPSKKKEALKLQEEIAALQAEINENDQKIKAPARSTDSPLSSQEKALQLKQEIEQELAK